MRSNTPTSSLCHAIAFGLVLLVAAGPALGEVLYWGDGTADSKRSIGGGGHLVVFDAGAEGGWLNRVELFGSRYGGEQPPDEDFHLYVVLGNGAILAEIALPYSLWERGEEYWRDLPIPPIQVPEGFALGVTFNAGRTKGVYVGVDTGDSHSYSWVPGSEGTLIEEGNWMLRATVEDEPAGDPSARELVVMNNGEAFFDVVQGCTDDASAIQTAGHGAIATSDIATVRFTAFKQAVPGGVAVVLVNGVTIEGQLISIGDGLIRIRDGSGAEREIPMATVLRIEF
jgi:hypothetical protein